MTDARPSDRATRFLRACRRAPVDRTPVWLMRQAGRYMAEYRALRARHAMLEIVRTPELAVEATLQPVDAFEVDAAIIFADILPLLDGMGLGLEFLPGEGPRLRRPVRSPDDVDRLVLRPPEETVGFTLDAIRLARRALGGRVPLIGFAGAPFTLACYAIEGAGSREFPLARRFMTEHPAAWSKLMRILAAASGDALAAQFRAGAEALQMFDSWAGRLTADEYRLHVLSHSADALRRAAAAGDAPVIHFAAHAGHLLPLLREAGGHILGVGSDLPLDEAWRRIGFDRAIQGNLDPEALLGPEAEQERQATDILARAGGRPGHIFNLGHGIRKETDPVRVRALVDFVHARPLASVPPDGAFGPPKPSRAGGRG